jgi:hypothetical protein
MTGPTNLQQPDGGISARDLFTPTASLDRAQTLLDTQFPSVPGTLRATQEGLLLSVQLSDINESTHDALPKVAQALALQAHTVVSVAVENTSTPPTGSHAIHSHSHSMDPLVVHPMIRTVVLDRPFSDAYIDIPGDMLADLYTEHTLGSLAHPNPAEFTAPSKEVTQVLSKFLEPHDFKIIKHITFLQVVLHGDAALVEEPVYFELSNAIAESNRQGYPIIITIVPETLALPTTHTSLTSTSSSAPQLIATPQLPTKDIVVTLATTVSATELDRESLYTLAETTRSLLRLKRESQWLDVEATSTGILLHSTTPLPQGAIESIEKKLELLPVRVDLVMPAQAKDSLSIADIKSIIKLTLPPTANLIRADVQAKDQLQKITIRIGVNPLEIAGLSKQLQELHDAFKPVGQDLAFKFDSRTSKLSARLESFHPRTLSAIFRASKGSGVIIPVDSFKYEERKLKLPESLSLLLHKYKHKHGARVFNDAPVVAFDSITAGLMHEDAYSVRTDGNRVIYGIHVVNGAFLLDPTSAERFQAYRNGSSFYTPARLPARFTAPMLPGLRGISLRTDKPCPAISMFVEVDARLLGHARNHTRKAALQPENVRFEFTEVKLAAAETYQVSDTGCEYKGTHRKEVAALQQLAELIREQELTVAPGSKSLELDIHTLLSYFNHQLTESLEGAFPLMYSSTSTVDENSLSTFLQDIAAQASKDHPIQELCKLGVKTLLSDDRLLYSLMFHFWSLPPTEKKNIWAPFTEPPPTTIPNLPHLGSGYRGYTPANKPLRNVAALVAQHQFNAQRDMYAPLSPDQVAALCERSQEQSELIPRLRRDLLLFLDLEFLGTRATMGIEARVLNNPHAPLYIELPSDQNRKYQLIEGQGKLRKLAEQTPAVRTITVWPLHYDVESDTFVFTLKKPH